MVSRSFYASLCLTVLVILVGHTQARRCPPTPEDVTLWVSGLVGSCMTDMLTTLRKSRDECSETVNNVDECLRARSSPCIKAVPDDDAMGMKMILSMAASSFLGLAPRYESIFCGGNVTNWDQLSPAMVIPGCGDDLTTAAAPCSDTFMEIIRTDPYDERLCSVYDDVTTCQTEKAKRYCPQLSAEQLKATEDSRKLMNFFCEKEITTSATDNGGSVSDDGVNDDDKVGDDGGPGSALSLKSSVPAFLAVLLFSVLSVV